MNARRFSLSRATISPMDAGVADMWGMITTRSTSTLPLPLPPSPTTNNLPTHNGLSTKSGSSPNAFIAAPENRLRSSSVIRSSDEINSPHPTLTSSGSRLFDRAPYASLSRLRVRRPAAPGLSGRQLTSTFRPHHRKGVTDSPSPPTANQVTRSLSGVSVVNLFVRCTRYPTAWSRLPKAAVVSLLAPKIPMIWSFICLSLMGVFRAVGWFASARTISRSVRWSSRARGGSNWESTSGSTQQPHLRSTLQSWLACNCTTLWSSSSHRNWHHCR